MKKRIFQIAGIAALFTGISAFTISQKQESSTELKWYTDAKEAGRISEETGKPVFAFFTGSDWCGWCMKLQRDVFVKQEFVSWAEKNVVLLELDFPKRKKLPAELANQNRYFAGLFGVRGYPTIWMYTTSTTTDTAGAEKFNITPLGSLGYPRKQEGVSPQMVFLNKANTILKKGGVAVKE